MWRRWLHLTLLAIAGTFGILLVQQVPVRAFSPYSGTLPMLDTSFSGSGVVAISDVANTVATDMVVLDNGGFLASTQNRVVRYHADGTPDTSFGTEGVATITFGGVFDARTIVVDSQNRIVVRGYVDAGSESTGIIARLLPDGILDPDFNSTGYITVTEPVTDAVRQRLVVQHDDTIIHMAVEEDERVMRRYLPTGALDMEFGINGEVSLGMAADHLIVHPAGIVVVGVDTATPLDSVAARRFFSDTGAPDLTFGDAGDNGVQRVEAATDLGATGIALDGNNRLLIGIYEHGTSDTPGVVRLRPGGGFDYTFSVDGVVRLSIPALDAYRPADMVVLDDERLLLFVTDPTVESEEGDFAALRLFDNGDIDSTFGTDGMVRGTVTGIGKISRVLMTENTLLIAGERRDRVAIVSNVTVEGGLIRSFGPQGYLALFRFAAPNSQVVPRPDGGVYVGNSTVWMPLNIDGELDSTYGNGGTITPPVNTVYGVGATQDDHLYVLHYAGWLALVTRYTATGQVDITFSEDGTAVYGYDLYSANIKGAMMPDGGVVTVFLEGYGADDGFHLVTNTARILPDGTRASGSQIFEGDCGIETVPSHHIAAAPDAFYYVAVRCETQGDVQVYRFTPQSELDLSFGIAGRVHTTLIAEPVHLTVQPDGKVLLLGASDSSTIQVVRYLPTGDPDPTFGVAGVVTLPFTEVPGNSRVSANDLTVDDNGRLVLLGVREWDGASFAVRLLGDGTPDSTFGVNGVDTVTIGTETDATDIEVQDGRAWVVGSSAFAAEGGSRFAVARYWFDAPPPPSPTATLSATVTATITATATPLPTLTATPTSTTTALPTLTITATVSVSTPSPTRTPAAGLRSLYLPLMQR